MLNEKSRAVAINTDPFYFNRIGFCLKGFDKSISDSSNFNPRQRGNCLRYFYSLGADSRLHGQVDS